MPVVIWVAIITAAAGTINAIVAHRGQKELQTREMEFQQSLLSQQAQFSANAAMNTPQLSSGQLTLGAALLIGVPFAIVALRGKR